MSLLEGLPSLEYGPAPESPAAAFEWISTHDAKFSLFVNGAFTPPSSKEYFDSINPAKGHRLAQISQASAADVDFAVQSARKAQPHWAALSGFDRAKYLYAIARHIQKNSRLFAVLESLDNGKPIRESRDIDIPLVARHFYYHAGWAQIFEQEFSNCEPIGVAGQIIPWNFPLLMLAWKIAPALATGNTIVLKPAEFTSLTALLFAEICERVGLPNGVVNIITGDGRTGECLVNHPDVDKIAFTGSTDVGRIIRGATAGTGKEISLELGGKSPFIVFENADIDSAIEGVVDAIWFNQGQVCCAGSRLLIAESVQEKVVAKLKDRMEKLRVGDPLDKAVDIGAIVAPVQLKRIEELVQKGESEGSKKWQPTWACPQEGYFFPPTLFTNVAPASSIAQVEIFGPVLVSMSFRTPEEAIALANNTRYGLAASVWSQDLDLALDVARQVKAGTVWVNCTNQFDAASGFGGYKESGFGREGGLEGLWDYVRERPGAATRNAKAASKESLKAAPLRIDETPKLYVGGKQVRPDSGYSREVLSASGAHIGDVGEGNRKDVRNAVEAARKSHARWCGVSGFARSQILYYIAENLDHRKSEFVHRLESQTGRDGKEEVERSVSLIFRWAAWADKYDGAVHSTITRNVTLAMNEPIGVIGVLAPNIEPLFGFLSMVLPCLALGNCVVAIPSQPHPLSVTDFYQVLEASDLPDGVLNIITGDHLTLGKVLAEHDDVDALWYCGDAEFARSMEVGSVGNLKRTWHLSDTANVSDRMMLRQAAQVKNIWIPYGA